MQWIRICGSLLLLTSLSACSSQSSADKLTKELQTVKSWAATSEMVADAWTKDNVPTVYAKKTLSTAQKELHKEIETIAKSSTNSTQQKTVLEQLQHLESILSQMSTAVEQGDKTAIASQLTQLSAQEQAIATLANPSGEQL